jgi:formate dehydrogenase major subunit
MSITRRGFLKGSAAAAFATAFGCATKDRPEIKTVDHWVRPARIKSGTETTTVCCFCGVGCGAIVTTATIDGVPKIVNLEGNPDHPINQGALCSKGSALSQIANAPEFSLANEPLGNNGARLANPMKRLPGGTAWTEITWATAISEIAAKIKAVRNHNVATEAPGVSFVTDDSLGRRVNRAETLYSLGGASLDNEECYLLSKMLRSLGIVYLEHQARI